MVFKRASGLQGRAMAHELSRRPLITQAGVQCRPRPLDIVMDMPALGQDSVRVFRLSNVSINPLLPHVYLNLKERRADERKGNSNHLLNTGKHWAEK